MVESYLLLLSSTKNAMLCCISYMCFGFNVVGFNELYPLWVSTSTDYSKYQCQKRASKFWPRLGCPGGHIGKIGYWDVPLVRVPFPGSENL